jgi:hypothetical protein
MWVLIAFFGLWFLYGKRYYAFRFNALEKKEAGSSSSSYFPYKLNRFAPRDFGFILSRASTFESKRSKIRANLFLVFFYIDLLILIFLKDIVDQLKL